MNEVLIPVLVFGLVYLVYMTVQTHRERVDLERKMDEDYPGWRGGRK